MADEREADAGVAGRAFDDQAPAFDDAAALAVEHHVLRGAVLDRAAGFKNSALPRIVQPVSSDALRSLNSGVLPTASMKS